MRKTILFLFLAFLCLPLSSAEDKELISIYQTGGNTEVFPLDSVVSIAHSRYDLNGREHDDYVTIILRLANGTERPYLIAAIDSVVTPVPIWETIGLTSGYFSGNSNSGKRRIYFGGNYPPDPVKGSETTFKWKRDTEGEGVYIHMKDQDTSYFVKPVEFAEDDQYANFEEVKVRKREEPLVIYYPGRFAKAYNKVTFAREQIQENVNNTMHIDTSGDCATDTAEYVGGNLYRFALNHHPVFLAFLLKSDRVPSVILKSVTMETLRDPQQGALTGTYTFDSNNGIDLSSVEDDEDKGNKITLKTPFYGSGANWLHTPRDYANSQDSASVYMVVPPLKWKDNSTSNFKFTFNVVDTLTRVDTTFVKTYKSARLNPNTVYTMKIDVPDTLFSIVDLGLEDIKYSFRNVESYFERGPVAFYGGKFAYGESNQKNDYGPGYHMDNYRGDVITQEFTPNYDAAFQRWGGCWRMPTTYELDSLMKKCKTEWMTYNGVGGALITGPSGKRIFLPVDVNCQNYWVVDSTKKDKHDFYWIDNSGSWHFYKQPVVAIRQSETDSVVYHSWTEFHNPGFCRGILEYSNDIRSNTESDGSLMLLRHIGESAADGENFTISGLVRSVRPWPTASTIIQLKETGFVFGTDSVTLYYNPGVDLTWDKGVDSLFIKQDSLVAIGEQTESFRPEDGKHLKLVDNAKAMQPYGKNDQTISVTLSGEGFLGYLNKERKYYVREYFVIENPVTGEDDYYYATKATRLKGYYPHTDRPQWLVGDETATLNGHVVGVSAQVVGDVGFIISDSIISETEYAEPTIATGKFYKADNGVDKNMKFSLTIGKDKAVALENKYYFIRAAFRTGGEGDDVSYDYAPEVKILHPLDTVDLGLPSGTLWANMNVRALYPEESLNSAKGIDTRDSTFVWNCDTVVNRYVTDISGTCHDVTFRKWFGNEGWTFAMPTKEQFRELMEKCNPQAIERFGERVIKFTGLNRHVMYFPAISAGWHWHTAEWTSNRPWNTMDEAFWDGCDYPDHGTVKKDRITVKHWVHPVLQVSAHLDSGEPLFVSTDTVGISARDRRKMEFWGRLLGITPTLKEKSTVTDGEDEVVNITRGFVLHDYKWGTHKAADSTAVVFFHEIPDLEQDLDSINGLYHVPLPTEVMEDMNCNTEYWYRAYIKVQLNNDTIQYRYGKPKKLSPLTIDIKDIDWEVHENSADLTSTILGTIFIKNKLEDDNKTSAVKTGFVVGKTPAITLNDDGTEKEGVKDWPYTFAENEVIEDQDYTVTMDVPKDTIYWVRAYIYADGKWLYSSPRQFGLDYVDLGLPSKSLWANLSVGSTYPEDDSYYYSIGEPDTKDHYHERTYIDEFLKDITFKINNVEYTTPGTTVVKPIDLTVKNLRNVSYTFKYIGAVHETFEERTSYCTDPQFWKHYSGTRNDAAFMNWETYNPIYVADKEKPIAERTYIDNSKFGNLFVEPNYKEWKELIDECSWVADTENEVGGYRVIGPNGNSIFLPYNGYRADSYGVKDNMFQWTDELMEKTTMGYYHVADSVLLLNVNGTRSTKGIITPASSSNLTSSIMYQGHSVRPIARYNFPLTEGADKLSNDTLAYLSTDTATYLNYRTAVVLQGTYRINYPLDEYELGFVVGERPDVTFGDALIKVDGISKLVRNGSQYFVALDKDDALKGDKTYYYRFYLKTDKFKAQYGGTGYYYADADTFHLAKHLTGHAEWDMYQPTATLHGLVQGVMPADDLTGFKAGIVIGYDRTKMTYETMNAGNTAAGYGFDDATSNCASQLTDNVGPISLVYTLPKDTTYYFRTYVYYNGVYHYGDINLFGCEMVDFGLPSGKKWASINVGDMSYSPNTGDYIGGIGQKYGVDVDTTQPFVNAGPGGMSDRAHTSWHNVSRMAYDTEMKELMENTVWTADTLFGCPGVRVTSTVEGYTDKSIFLRHSYRYFNSDANRVVYSLSYDSKKSQTPMYLDIYRNNPEKQGKIGNSSSYEPGCNGMRFLRPIWESSDTLRYTDSNSKNRADAILLRTDDAIVHPMADNVTFFGTVLGLTQQHLGDASPYQIPGIEHAGFIVGTDTLVAHKDDADRIAQAALFKYDFPHADLKTDSVYFNTTANINLFKVKEEYWVRTYVKIDGKFYYGPSLKFVRRPDIITGDVDWQVGRQTAVLFANVTGFNASFVTGAEGDDDELESMEDLKLNAQRGIIVGYQNNLTHESPASAIFRDYHESAVNGKYSMEVPYEKDTTYYYRAYIKYDNTYVYADSTNHYGLEFVDLGFKNRMHWASISIGSRYAEDKDSLQQFAWGETEYEKNHKFTFDNYKYYYATGDDEYNNLGNEIKGSQYDAAHVRWNYTWDDTSLGGTKNYGGRGALWVMPSEDDLQMLVDSCVWTDSVSHAYNPKKNTYDEVKGYKVTSKMNGRYIFISKERVDEWTIKGTHSDRDGGPWEYGPLWTSSRAPRDRNAYGMEVGTKNEEASKRLMKYHYRYHGHNIRPIAHLNVTLADGKKMSITTERTSWTAGDSLSTIYGCALGLNSKYKASYGFLWSNTASTDAALRYGNSGVNTIVCETDVAEGGLFHATIHPLDNTKMYYFRAFLKVGSNYYYGDVKEFGIVMVDLGLSVKWANVNMGSWKNKDHGNYYAWGETDTKDAFTQDGYKYYNTTTGAYRDLGTNISANDTTDVAHKFLGGLWRMPGDREWQELLTNCTWTSDTVGHVPGYTVTSNIAGYTDKSIFLPTNYFTETVRDANYEYETNEESEDYQGGVNHDDEQTHRGYYWSSNRSINYRKAGELQFNMDDDSQSLPIEGNMRWRGNAIRPVASTTEGKSFYVRTEGTDWRYGKEKVKFYSAVLFPEADLVDGELPDGYEVGFLLKKGSAEMDQLNADTIMLAQPAPSEQGSGNFIATIDHSLRNDGEYFYRAFVRKDGVYTIADARQFGLQDVDMDGMTWANINVDAASPEQFGLNGTLTGRYAEADPAYVEFGGLWRLPTEQEKIALLDEEKYTWTQNDEGGQPIYLYESKVWKVISNISGNYIYLTSKDPAEWGCRALAETNLTLDPGDEEHDNKHVYLRTDSTSWRAGYSGDLLYATLVGSAAALDGITSRGFVIGNTSDVTEETKLFSLAVATPEQTSSSAFAATMPDMGVGTYYYRAYVEYKGVKYYAENACTVGMEFVDLALPSGLKWLSVNIGSTQVSDLGDKYMWGDVTPRTEYSTDLYPYYTNLGYTDIGSDISNTDYDVATLRISESRMPTNDELTELRERCTWTLETLNGVQGYRVTGTNDNSIFLPIGDAVGPRVVNQNMYNDAYYGYWTATRNDRQDSQAEYLKFAISNKEMTLSEASDLRYLGKLVRPVMSSLITTTNATDIGMSGATLNMTLNTTASAGNYGFELSLSPNMSTGITTYLDNIELKPGTTSSYRRVVNGLEEGTLYYFRAFVIVDDGGVGVRKYGAIKNFSTMSSYQNTPIAIDLGFTSGVQWGDRNVNAYLPEQEGDYYAWGELETRESYSKATYMHITDNDYHDIGTNISATEWDVVNAKYTGCWRMPTQIEMAELINSSTWTWSSKSGVPGYWVESNINHKKIFLPAVGYEGLDYRIGDKTRGYYWTSSIGNPTSNTSYSLRFSADNYYVANTPGIDYYRELGYSVRPVFQSNFTWGSGDDTRYIFIRTDSISYAADFKSNTLHGTMLGLESESDLFTQGFVIGTNSDVIRGGDGVIEVKQRATANGAYSLVVDSETLQSLIIGENYYVRAFISNGTNTSYGDAILMSDYTFFTDGVEWGLGNEGTLTGHVKATKPESGLTVGFYYAAYETEQNMNNLTDINGKLRNGKALTASFGTGDEADIFTAVIDTVKVYTYYYQAFTRYDGVEHYGEVKSFGSKRVNLGLPSKVEWVDMNLGSTTERETGDGYRWGETLPNQSDAYNVSAGYQYVGGTEYDAAHTRLGIRYRIPSIENIQELIDNCDWEWAVSGFRVKSRTRTVNGQPVSIFLPVGSYWSSQQGAAADGDGNATSLQLIDGNTKTPNALQARTLQLMLRPIYSPTGAKPDESGGGAGEAGIGGGIEGNE